MNSICSLRFTYQDALGEFVTALRLPEDCLNLGGPTDRNSYTGSVRDRTLASALVRSTANT